MSWPRLRTCNLASSEDTWVSTVRTDRNSAAAMSALDFPSPTNWSTSASRSCRDALGLGEERLDRFTGEAERARPRGQQEAELVESELAGAGNRRIEHLE